MENQTSPAPARDTSTASRVGRSDFAKLFPSITNPPPGPTPEQWAAENARRERRSARDAELRCENDWRDIVRSIGTRYANCTLENYLIGNDDRSPYRAKALAEVAAYCGDICNRIDAGDCCTLFGTVGTGKDHLMVAMIRAAIFAGKSVRWINGMDLFSRARDDIENGKSEASMLREFSSPDVLAISDPVPPRGDISDFQSSNLFRIIDRRYRDCKPVWVTLNVASGAEADSRIGTSVVDRLRDHGTAINFNWPSHRRTTKP